MTQRAISPSPIFAPESWLADGSAQKKLRLLVSPPARGLTPTGVAVSISVTRPQ